MTRLCNSMKQNIRNYYGAYMSVLLAFNAIRTARVCCTNPVETFFN